MSSMFIPAATLVLFRRFVPDAVRMTVIACVGCRAGMRSEAGGNTQGKNADRSPQVKKRRHQAGVLSEQLQRYQAILS